MPGRCAVVQLNLNLVPGCTGRMSEYVQLYLNLGTVYRYSMPMDYINILLATRGTARDPCRAKFSYLARPARGAALRAAWACSWLDLSLRAISISFPAPLALLETEVTDLRGPRVLPPAAPA
eukprot:SAG31_NODE_1107_length_9877_cov_4.000102_5_plen_122_part_00